MLGTLRLALALAVLISHVGVSVATLNPGVVAVVVFYAISGYVMHGLCRTHYGSLAKTPHFYLDRLLRILPQYLLYLSGACLWYVMAQRVTIFTQRPPTWHDAFNNLSIVPLNFFMYNQSDHFTLIPPAWSLGAELQFYLIVPLLMASRRLFWVFGCLSLAVQALAWAGLLHPDWWGYRLLPGVLWIFVMGMLLNHLHAGQHRQRELLGKVVACTLVFFVLIATLLGYFERLKQPYFREVIIGAALAVSLLAALGALKPASPRLARLDAWLGHLSYGVFLNHFFLLWLLGWEGRALTGNERWLLMGLSLLASGVSFMLVEAPILRWRRGWRRRKHDLS
jgi:peptidoglycan/LPS O-acetylase OafA/YrhL